MISRADIQAATDKALDYIASVQRADGGFVSFSSPRLDFRTTQTYQTTFVPALVMSSLQNVPGARNIQTSLNEYVLAQRSANWSFNYWTRNAMQRLSMPYPDDLDDTFCALIALYGHDPRQVDAATLAAIVKLLVATEQQPGGPYRTWLVGPSSPKVWLDVDVAVNANVAYFLSLIGSRLPSLEAYLNQAIAADMLTSPYYPSVYPIVYYCARVFATAQHADLVDVLMSRQREGYWQTPLQTALAVSALVKLGSGYDLSKACDYLLEQQRPDGSWAPEAFCIDPMREGQTHYHGAGVLTTAFAIEALSAYDQQAALQSKVSKVEVLDSGQQALFETVVSRAQNRLNELDTALREQAHRALDTLLHGTNKHEIVLLPSMFGQSLRRPVELRDEVYIQLGLANLYGWMAYTVYDDFLDEEGKPEQLSAANVALRCSLESFRKAVPSGVFQELVAQTFDGIDAANAWETSYCRFPISHGVMSVTVPPDYGDRMRLAERSLGHALTPLAVLIASGVQVQALAALQAGFRHYLIAKQISDDMHDWQDDLRIGHISFVVSNVLREMRLQPGPYTLETMLPSLERQFWNHSLPRLCDVVLQHIAEARIALSAELKPDNDISKLLDKIEASMEYTQQQQSQAKLFLDSYHA